MTAAEKAIDDAERRDLRDSWRANGGSRRRALRSFQTKADKRSRREAHAGTIGTAVAQLADPGGFEAWLESLALNPHLSAMNCALVALQTPGEVVNTSAGWHREGFSIRAGHTEAGRITAPGFWPLAYFTAADAGAVPLMKVDAPLPIPARAEALRSALSVALAEGAKPRPALDHLASVIRAESGHAVRPRFRPAEVEVESLF